MRPAKSFHLAPVYLQLADLLARKIEAGYWQPGERLPTEADLAQRLEVALGTLRKALALLEQRGVIARIQGSGTYVKKFEGGQRIYELFRLELTSGPGLPTARIVDVSRLPRPTYVPPLDEIKNKEAWRVRRVRLLNETPVALEEIWFDASHAISLHASDLDNSMYLFYQERFNLWISRVEDRVSAAAAPSWACAPCRLKSGEIAGYVERVSRTSNNQIVEYSRTWFDPELCLYSNRMAQ